MSAPGEPVPTLELPSDKLMQWSQLALLLSSQLAARRERLERLAWSEGEHAARADDLAGLRGGIEPAVRVMTAEEIAHWPSSGDDVTGTTAPVSAEVAPLGERWALHATARGDQDTLSHIWVSCREETLARGLASEILRRGEPEAVHRLGAHVQLAEGLIAAQRAHAPASAPPVDRDAMAEHIQGAWPPHAATAALGCRAWPTLADKLAAAQHEGHDLDRLLRGMNTGGIPTARKPAALASWMLDQATAGGVSEGGHGRVPEQLSGSRHPHHDEILSWVDQLDPASMIDRAGALGIMGYCGTGIDTRLVTRFPDLLDDAARGAGDAAAAEGLAGDRERSAAAHQASADDQALVDGAAGADDDLTEAEFMRQSMNPEDLAERDLHEAAAAHATAAGNRGAAHAAVARASVTTTAPSATATPRPTPTTGPTPRPQPTPSQRGPRMGR